LYPSQFFFHPVSSAQTDIIPDIIPDLYKQVIRW